MWQPIYFNPFESSQPVQLRVLKEQLANVVCKCSTCNYYTSDDYCDAVKCTKDVEVQAERYTPVNPTSHYLAHNIIKDALCPTCCLTLNVLRGGVVRVLKDEESETVPTMFSHSKSTGKRLKLLEKATSFESKNSSNSYVGCQNAMSGGSSEITVRAIGIPSNTRRRRSGSDRVTFVETPQCLNKSPNKHISGHSCLCLEDFIESIRLPFNIGSRYP